MEVDIFWKCFNKMYEVKSVLSIFQSLSNQFMNIFLWSFFYIFYIPRAWSNSGRIVHLCPWHDGCSVRSVSGVARGRGGACFEDENI